MIGRWSLLSLLIRTLVVSIIGTNKAGHDGGAKDLEILILRHQLRVLQRRSGPPTLRAVDRVLLAAASRAIPRDRDRSGFRPPRADEARIGVSEPGVGWAEVSLAIRATMIVY